MKKILLYTTCLFLWLACGDTPSNFNPIVAIPEVILSENQNYRIGVVGSGIGGASFVHFINQAAAKNCQITVYEKENRIGGRVKKDKIVTATGLRDTFDIVILACPLDLANITLPEYKLKMDRAYQTVHANFIAGTIDYSYFNNVGNQPQTIFTIESPDIPFVSIAKTSYAPKWDLPIYKVFSREPLDDSFFDQAFKNRKGRIHQEWKAYTVLSPMADWPPFKIDEGLYYINAMESAVSAMETEAVAARNIANLTMEYMQRGLKN